MNIVINLNLVYSPRKMQNIELQFWFFMSWGDETVNISTPSVFISSIKFTLFCTSSTTHHHLENIIVQCCCIIWTLRHEFYVTITRSFILSYLLWTTKYYLFTDYNWHTSFALLVVVCNHSTRVWEIWSTLWMHFEGF